MWNWFVFHWEKQASVAPLTWCRNQPFRAIRGNSALRQNSSPQQWLAAEEYVRTLLLNAAFLWDTCGWFTILINIGSFFAVAKFLIFFESKVGKTHLLYLIDTWHIETISSCEKKLRTQCYFFFLYSLICAEGNNSPRTKYSSISLCVGREGGKDITSSIREFDISASPLKSVLFKDSTFIFSTYLGSTLLSPCFLVRKLTSFAICKIFLWSWCSKANKGVVRYRVTIRLEFWKILKDVRTMYLFNSWAPQISHSCAKKQAVKILCKKNFARQTPGKDFWDSKDKPY